MDRKTEFKKKRDTIMILMFLVPGIAFIVGSYLASDFLFSTCRGVLIYATAGRKILKNVARAVFYRENLTQDDMELPPTVWEKMIFHNLHIYSLNGVTINLTSTSKSSPSTEKPICTLIN